MIEGNRPIVHDPALRDREERELRRVSDFHAALLAMAGHDLRQPLQVIMATHEWLTRRLIDGPERQYLDRGQQALAQLVTQLNHLVDALHLHERAGGIRAAPLALAPLLADLGQEYGDAAKQKRVSLRVLPSHVMVMSDGVLLDGILRNLLRNAIKYTPPGGKVLVGCRRRGPMLRIEVHDTGLGIAPDDLARVFNAFHKVDVAHADGLGLGLFIVRRAADSLGHRIEVQSAIGRGSCFTVVTDAAAMPANEQGLTARFS